MIYWSQMICTVKKHIMSGGPRRLPFTIPPLVFSALRVCMFLVSRAPHFFVFLCIRLVDLI